MKYLVFLHILMSYICAWQQSLLFTLLFVLGSICWYRNWPLIESQSDTEDEDQAVSKIDCPLCTRDASVEDFSKRVFTDAQRKRHFGDEDQSKQLPSEKVVITQVVNVGRIHFGYCREHKVKWKLGENLFSSWRHETAEDWQANAAFLAGYREIAPDLQQVRARKEAAAV